MGADWEGAGLLQRQDRVAEKGNWSRFIKDFFKIFASLVNNLEPRALFALGSMSPSSPGYL